MPVEHLPFNIEGGAPGLELPDVGAQLGLVLLVWNDIYIMHFLHISQYMHQGWIGYRDYRPQGSIHSIFN